MCYFVRYIFAYPLPSSSTQISFVLQHFSSHCLSVGQILGIHFIKFSLPKAVLQNWPSGQQTEPHFLSNGQTGLSNIGAHWLTFLSQYSSLSQHSFPHFLIWGQGGSVALALHSLNHQFLFRKSYSTFDYFTQNNPELHKLQVSDRNIDLLGIDYCFDIRLFWHFVLWYQ